VDVSPSADFFSAVGVLGKGSGNGPGLMGLSDGVVPLSASAISAAVFGLGSIGNRGVFGTSSGSANGVQGSCHGTPGLSGSRGVAGFTDVGVGVLGAADVGTGVYGYAVGGNAVYGLAYGAGASQVVAGVFGDSTQSYGVIGRTTKPGYSGLTAIAGTTGVAALAATSTNANAYAAYFSGTTVVQGNFVATGGVKSAAVKDATGQHRLVYCVESPESWFEDFGEGTLVGGKADVKLDPVFAQIAHTDHYHVFLTTYGDNGNGLNVTERRADGFTVTERNKGMSGGAFSYRVVAKRADIKGERLAKFNLMKINIPDESKLQRPEPPKGVPSPLPPTKP
jgi:hypothetical protein